MVRLARALFPAAAAALVALASCGGKVVLDRVGGAGPGGSSTSTSGSTATTGAGGACVISAGDCTTDADCSEAPFGGTCAPITPGGYLVCLDVTPEATSCMPPQGGTNQCCASADCAQGKCFTVGGLPCGGPALHFNVCFTDQCESDADCVDGGTGASEACIPAGAYTNFMRTCLTAYCHTDADCTARPCGVCAPIVGPCCAMPTGLGCVYPGGCAKNADCGQGRTCALDPATGTGVCMAGSPPCPG